MDNTVKKELSEKLKNTAELTGEELTNATGGEMHNYYCKYCDLRLGPIFPEVLTCPGCKNVLTLGDTYYE